VLPERVALQAALIGETLRDRIRHLSKGVAIYGAGDAAVTLVNFFLLPVYVKSGFLVAADFGALAIISSIEAFAKVICRWGLDGAFMRFYNERDEGLARQRMASTIVWFLLVANGILLALAQAGAGLLARLVSLDAAYLTGLRLMLLNMFLIAFTFVPFHVMRLRDEAATFSAFTLARSAGTVILRIVLVIGFRQSVTGIYLADVILTLVLAPLLWPWCRSIVKAVFSRDELRQVLRFGLPRLPHGLASQTLDGNPKLMLGRHALPSEVGVYQNGVTLGTAVAFFKNAFETAFAPFYYATARDPDARQVFSKMTTYGVGVLVLLAAGSTAVARDVVLLLLMPEYLAAVTVVPLVAMAFAMQGIYQLTSIGLNLTRRTEFYSVSTISAALVSIGAGLWLIPRYTVVGAAATVLVSYAVQLTVATVIAHRLYPVHYEIGRLLRIVLAGVVAVVAAARLVPPMGPLAGLLLHGLVTVGAYGLVLVGTGFFRSTELAFLREVAGQMRRRAFSGASSDAG
jgi:O-antigen/teichoic acid export membrane protein